MRSYGYVGPKEIWLQSRNKPQGTVINTLKRLRAWLLAADRESNSSFVVATFVIDLEGRLCLAPRRSEHVACAGSERVLSAGEMAFHEEGSVIDALEVTNQSTGYCPEPVSWKAVEAALDAIGVTHPGAFTTEVIFRRCDACSQINIVKDGWYSCLMCGSELASDWNFDAIDQ